MKIIFLIISFFISFSGFAQFNGIGIFKINKTDVSILDTIIRQSFRTSFDTASYQNVTYKATFEKTLKSINESDFEYNPEIKIIELLKDSSGEYDAAPEAKKKKNVRVFFLNHYHISSISIENIYLTFFHDTLIQFKCKSTDELEEAITLKYGKPFVKTETKPVVCQNGFGAKFYHDERSSYSTWVTKFKNISAKETDLFWYSSIDCSPMSLKEFLLKDEFKKKLIDTIEDSIWSNIDKKKEKEKAKSLKDF